MTELIENFFNKFRIKAPDTIATTTRIPLNIYIESDNMRNERMAEKNERMAK